MIVGAARELKIGDPRQVSTHSGPVIDADAKARLDAHIARMKRTAKVHYGGEARVPSPLVGEAESPPGLAFGKPEDRLRDREGGASASLLSPPLRGRGGEGGVGANLPYVGAGTPAPNPSPQGGGEQGGAGYYVVPHIFELDRPEALAEEVFGPVLHVARYRAGDLDRVLDAIEGSGYGLTLGIHSRIDATALRIARRLAVGNVYVNRNMIGAVVGVQPFGGHGLSGTGPKAGGPHYLLRFATEQTVTANTAAAGGNATLMGIGE
jgi:RHH-type proline utilization regulon transcriptional repressor/proline dehydrogenase/delta 1-pyrroline-5-carboxylate dehydrogenase